MTTLTNHQNDQLFTELTSEESAVIEGGAILLQRVDLVKKTRGEKGNEEIRVFDATKGFLGYNNNMSLNKIWKMGSKGKGLRATNIRNVYLGEFDGFDKNGNAKYGYLTFKSMKKRSGNNRLATFKGVGGVYRMAYKVNV